MSIFIGLWPIWSSFTFYLKVRPTIGIHIELLSEAYYQSSWKYMSFVCSWMWCGCACDFLTQEQTFFEMNYLCFLENVHGKPPGAGVFWKRSKKPDLVIETLLLFSPPFLQKDLRCPGINYKTNLKVLRMLHWRHLLITAPRHIRYWCGWFFFPPLHLSDIV